MENQPTSPGRTSKFSNTFNTFSGRQSILVNVSNTFNRSMISTSKSKNSATERNRSQIKALPNYNPHSLSKAIPFVTIFQCIEIERLSQEIQIQRARLHEAEKQAFNAVNYEIQIQELSKKCTLMEDEISQYQQQLSKMNKICETLYHENQQIKDQICQQNSEMPSKRSLHDIFGLKEQQARLSEEKQSLIREVERWRQKYEDGEKNRQEEMQQMRQIIEIQRKSMVQREIKDLQYKHQTQIANLNLQIKRLTSLVQIKQTQIQDLRHKAKNSDDYIKELQDYGNKLSEYEGKISMLSQQHLRLSQIVDHNSVQLNNARKKQFKLAQQIQTGKDVTIDNQHLRDILQSKQRQLERWKQNIVNLENEVSKGKQLYLLNQEYQAKNQHLKQENQRMIKIIRQRTAQIQKWKKMALEHEEELYNIKQKEYNSVDLEGRERILKVENQRLENLLKARNQELQDFKEKNRQLQTIVNNFGTSDKQKKSLEEKYKIQIERNKKLEIYVDQLQQNLIPHNTCSLKQQELQEEIQFHKKEIEGLRRQLGNNECELNELKKTSGNFNDQQKIAKKITSNQVQQLEERVELMSQQIQRLNSLLKKKNEDITVLQDEKIKNYSISTECKKLYQEINEKEEDIKSLKAQLVNCESKLKEYEAKLFENEKTTKQKIKQLSNKQKYLTQKLNRKVIDYEDIREKYTKMEAELKEINNIQKLCQKQQNRITVYLRDLEQSKKDKQNLEMHLAKEQQACQELREIVMKLQKNNSSLNNTSKSIIQKKMSRKDTSDQILSMKEGQEIDMLLRKINTLQSTVFKLKENYENLLNAVEQAEQNNSNSFRSNQTNDIYESRVSTLINQ